ncbi:MAG: hypothetical protein AAF799_33940 [Myxococcota bacterium]
MASTPPTTGLQWDTDDGLPRRITSEDGTVLVHRTQDGDAWRLVVRTPEHREVTLVPDATTHPVLGRCDVVLDAEGEVLAHASAIDWRRPQQIPALDRPAALPRGAGTAILNLLAWQAQRATTGPLRYHGPYPSEALWASLQSSFRVDEDPAQARARFMADAEARALAGTRGPIDVAFVPQPHTWTWASPRVCLQRRDGLERVYVDGRAFDRDGIGPRRLTMVDGVAVAQVVVGSEAMADIARVGPQGRVEGEPGSLPPAPADLVGQPLPDPILPVLAQVLCAQAPRLLQPAVRETLDRVSLRWGDTGDELVAFRGGAFELHAAVVGYLPTDPTALLAVLIQLLQAPVRRVAAAAMAEAWAAAQG